MAVASPPPPPLVTDSVVAGRSTWPFPPRDPAAAARAAASAPSPPVAPAPAAAPLVVRRLDERGRLVEPSVSDEDRRLAVFLHLSPLLVLITPVLVVAAPLVFWAFVRGRSSFVDDHGRAVLDFTLSYTLWFILTGITVVGLVLWPVLVVFGLVSMIRGAIGAGERRYVRYPATIAMAT